MTIAAYYRDRTPEEDGYTQNPQYPFLSGRFLTISVSNVVPLGGRYWWMSLKLLTEKMKGAYLYVRFRRHR
jgi:hypothetical protein